MAHNHNRSIPPDAQESQIFNTHITFVFEESQFLTTTVEHSLLINCTLTSDCLSQALFRYDSKWGLNCDPVQPWPSTYANTLQLLLYLYPYRRKSQDHSEDIHKHRPNSHQPNPTVFVYSRNFYIRKIYIKLQPTPSQPQPLIGTLNPTLDITRVWQL